MSDCNHHFEHVKQTRPFTEREYMQCTKCGYQNPLGLFQHWDTHRDGPAIKWPPRIDFARNSYVYQYDPKVMPKKSAIDYLIDAFKDAFTVPFKPKRQPIIRIRRIWVQAPFQTWHWQCTKCDHHMKPREIGSTHYGELCFTWADAYHQATRHAHNHH